MAKVMHLRLFVLLFIIGSVTASFWDGVPFVSQIKSAAQLIARDKEGARKTQENFLKQAPIFSQVKTVAVAVANLEH